MPEKKDEKGTQAWAEDGVVQQAIKVIRNTVPELLVITDVCLCAYTSSGHCGVVKNNKVDNDSSSGTVGEDGAIACAGGADMVAPSDMMDGRVGFIRECLDKNGFSDTAIMAYSAKYASAFYGPFSDVADSAPAFGDRKSYQMDIANSRQAMREIELDIEEGADIVMVKPALSYLDIISQARQRFDVPIAAYNVSGEYMMLNAAAEAGVIDRRAGMLEMLYSIKRAGADIIITYFAKEAAKILKNKIKMAAKITKPRFIAFEVTRKCRFACRHCRAHAGYNENESGTDHQPVQADSKFHRGFRQVHDNPDRR